jgi:hypothetical protein
MSRRTRPGPVGLLGILTVVALLALSCTRNAPEEPPLTPLPTSGPPASTSPSQVTGKLKLGTLTVTSGQDTCSGPQACHIMFEVTCPQVEAPAAGDLIVTPASTAPKGLVMILLGGRGTGMEGVTRAFLQMLRSDRFETVILSWQDSWLEASPGETVGPKRLACRSATAIKWAHDNLYQALGAAPPGLGGCGFCLHGNSGGASQIAYALSFYGLDKIVDAAVLSGGPPHAALAKGCLREPEYAFDKISARIIDASYGFLDEGGPCEKADPSFADHWNQDSADAGGVYKIPDTRVAFVFVQGDPTVGPSHGKVYLEKLQAANSPCVTDRTIPGTMHTIELMPNGRTALAQALLASC